MKELAIKSGTTFDRWLHRSYFRIAGIKYHLFQRLRPAGIALLGVIILAACLSLGHHRVPAYLLFSFAIGMLFTGLPSVFLRRAHLEAKRHLPRYATVDQLLSYQVHVRHLGKGHLRRAWLLDAPPDPRPSHEDFHHIKEPGEDERNLFDRKFAYFRWTWLLLRNRLCIGGNAPEMLDLVHGAEAKVNVCLTPLRRGVIRLDDLRVLLPDAFGIFQASRKVSAPPATLIVLPRRYPLPPLELPGGGSFRSAGEASTNESGNSGEFVGLRDYRPGDPLRQIHWKSWARTGRPIVKELEKPFYPHYGLVVDTLSGSQSDLQFEETISVAASFAAAIDTSHTLLDLLFIKTEAHRVTVGRGVERAEKLLEVLASVTPQRESHYDQLARLVMQYQEDLTCCLVILNGWDAQRAEFLKKLTHHGIICSPIIIGVGIAPEGLPGAWLQSGNIARDLQRLRGRLHSA